MEKIFGIIASFYGLLAVVLGAFGAHALKNKLDIYQHSIFEKAVSYQFYHVAALIAVICFSAKYPSKYLAFAGWSFTAGILLFCGSLYLLATRHLTGLDGLTPVLGPITPLGGLAFIAGWIFLLISFTKL